jgi:hypothetical protein
MLDRYFFNRTLQTGTEGKKVSVAGNYGASRDPPGAGMLVALEDQKTIKGACHA